MAGSYTIAETEKPSGCVIEGAKPGTRPDAELRLLLAMTRALPRVKGAVRLAMLARKFYLRKERALVAADVLGLKMNLDPSDWVQGGLLFWPQLWDYQEFRFLRRHLRQGDIFLDIGAHVGFNSLILSRLVGPGGFILAAEAAPDLFAQLKEHLTINDVRNVRAVNLAISDCRATKYLARPQPNNSAGRSLLPGDPEGTPVECVPLSDLVYEYQLPKVSGAWLEIAGGEYKVLDRYFRDCGRTLWPKFLIVEHNQGWAAQAGGDVWTLLKKSGYREQRVQMRPSNGISNRSFLLVD